MSWSISLFGTPAKVAEAIVAESDKLSGKSKEEYDDAKGALVSLVLANSDHLISVSASGHGSYDKDGNRISGSCTASVQASFTFVG